MPFRPSPRQLEYLLAVAEAGHFGLAARKCHVSQPTLSVQLQLLEDQLGVQLIDRTPGNVGPTAAGEQVIVAAKAVLAGLDDMVALATSSRDNLGGTIRLGVVPTFGPYFMPRLLPRLHQSWRDLKVYIREDRPLSLEDAVRLGDTDCALGPLVGDETVFSFRPICTERFFLGVCIDHPLARETSVDISALRGERLLTLGKGHRLLDNVRDLATRSGATLVDDYEGTSLDAIRQMVSIDMGLSLFPELYVRSEFRKEENVRLLTIKGWKAERSIGFYWRKNAARAAHYEALAALGESVARELVSTPLLLNSKANPN